MKFIGIIGLALRRALNEHRGFVGAPDISDAVWQASNTVFGHKRGHSALYRPGQPLPPEAYQLTQVLDMALHPLLREQVYAQQPLAGQLPLLPDGTLAFPIARDANGVPSVENSFQYPTALLIAGARRVVKLNDNAVQQAMANSITSPTRLNPAYYSVPGGYGTLPLGLEQLTLKYLAAPPRPVFAEMPDPTNPFELVYDDGNSVDVGWQDVTALNEIMAYATRLLGGQVKDAQAISMATQTAQLGA